MPIRQPFVMKVLLADDEPIARTMLEHWLVGWGYQVTTARDGEQALRALANDRDIRLCIVDWVMPKLDGVDVCKAIRSGPQEPYTYLLLLTARDNKNDIVHGLDAGADDYLVKPCNPLELKVRLRAGKRVIELEEQLVGAREALRVEAMHDSLTGLLNRTALFARLDQEIARSKRSGSQVCLIMIDLDRFKRINDRFGHPTGDAVLSETAKRFLECIRSYDSLGRIGGEEFMLVLPDCDTRFATVVAERLRRSLCEVPIKTSENEIDVSASFGLVSSEHVTAPDLQTMVRIADCALYRAKDDGRNRVCIPTPSDLQAEGRRDRHSDADDGKGSEGNELRNEDAALTERPVPAA